MNNIKEYIEKNHIDDIAINIILNTGLIVTFISIFFFMHGSIVEKKIVQDQSLLLTTHFVTTIKPFLTPELSDDLKNSLKEKDFSHEDEKSNEHNNMIKNNAYTNIIFFFGICILSALLISIYFIKPRTNLIILLGINLIMLVIVALTEYSFVALIPANYITADPNYIIYKLLRSFREKLIIPNTPTNTPTFTPN
jgi:hypothetical protein